MKKKCIKTWEWEIEDQSQSENRCEEDPRPTKIQDSAPENSTSQYYCTSVTMNPRVNFTLSVSYVHPYRAQYRHTHTYIRLFFVW